MCSAATGAAADLGTQFRHLGTQPLELGPLLRAQGSIVRHSAAVLVGVTMAPSPIEMDAVITHNG